MTTTSERSKTGCEVKGSSGKTSRAAPASLPDSRPVEQRVEVDQLAAGAVDDPGALPHRGDRLGVDPAHGLRRLRQVEGDDLGSLEDLGTVLGALHPELAEALGGDELVEGDDLHLEGLGALRDQLADPAEAENAERLAVELGSLEFGAVPAARDQRAVGLRHVAAEGQHQRHRVLRRGDRVRLGCVGDDDPPPGGRLDVDVVDARCRPARSPSAARRPRSDPRSASSPSGSGSRRSRGSPRAAPRGPSPGRGRPRSWRGAGRRRIRRSSP